MKRVITYGTFDLLHYGHISLLRRARALGDYLVVALSTDEFTLKEKRKRCYFSYEQRKVLLEAVRYVDLVIPEESWEQKRRDARELRIDIFAIGDDWKGKFDFLKDEGCEVVYLPRTPEISTTQIKSDLKQFTPPPCNNKRPCVNLSAFIIPHRRHASARCPVAWAAAQIALRIASKALYAQAKLCLPHPTSCRQWTACRRLVFIFSSINISRMGSRAHPLCPPAGDPLRGSLRRVA